MRPIKLYRLNVTANGEPSAIFAIAEDVDSLLHALEDQNHGEADEKSLLAYYDGDKKPRVIRSLEEVSEDYNQVPLIRTDAPSHASRWT